MSWEIVLAEEIEGDDIDMPFESYTWTYYRLATKKGLVVLRFFGSSKGYYSEKVSIAVKGSWNIDPFFYFKYWYILIIVYCIKNTKRNL